MTLQAFFGNFLQSDTGNTGGGAREVGFHHFVRNTDYFKGLGSLVALQG